MNETGRRIIDDINVEIKKTNGKYGTYIPVSVFKECIKKHYSAVDKALAQMIEKRYAYYSKSGKAITLSKGLIDGFVPYTCGNANECFKFAERMATQAVEDFGKISNLDWFNKYYFDPLIVCECHEPTSVHQGIGISLNKYHQLDTTLKLVYWEHSNQAELSRKKQQEDEIRRQAERKREEEELQKREDALLKTGKYCVCFDEYSDYTEYDSGEVLNYCEPEKEEELIRFFETLEEAKDFADFIAEHIWDSIGDSFCDYWEYDVYTFNYRVTYCGEYEPTKHTGKVRLLGDTN